MFLHIGEGHMIPASEVVLIADYESTLSSKRTEEFFQVAEEEGFVVDYSSGDPRSFILTGETVYLSMISSATLRKRMNKFSKSNGGS